MKQSTGCGRMMNREYDREHMIFQLLVNTAINANVLENMTNEELRELYDKYVKAKEEMI